MSVKVYEINTDILVKEITIEQRDNIDIIFKELVGDGMDNNHLTKICLLPNISQKPGAVLYDYSENKESYNFYNFAEKLYKSELTDKGQRSKNISEGFLFVKQSENKLILMKLEKTDVIDSQTFAKRGELGMDKAYYKVCVFSNDFDNIKVIDKNKKAAKYWYNTFLDLEFKRTNDDNTRDLIEFIEDRTLFSDEIERLDNILEIIETTKKYLFEQEIFDKSELKDLLNRKKLIDVKNESELYSDKIEHLDCDFSISKKVLAERYKRTIEISDTTKIKTDNFESLLLDHLMYMNEDNELVFKVKGKYLKNLKKSLGM